MSALAIRVADVTEGPRRFPLEADAAWWQESRGGFHDPDSRVLQPFAVDLEAYRLGRRLVFRGEVTGEVELCCGRCAELYAHAFRERLELLLEPLPPSEDPPRGGIELDPDDLELGRYAGEELDFGAVFREILAFAWPMQPRCTESCRGLCPVCGVDRNQESCRCEASKTSRPFAGLARLLGGRGSQSS